jgi:protein-tyrosine phosphatase
MIPFCDIHQHCLYGLDDGAQTAADMQQMLECACRDGADTIVATPHCAPGAADYPLATVRERAQEARAYCLAQGLSIAVVVGAEVLYTPALHNVIRDRALPTLGGTRHVLVEFVPDIGWRDLRGAVALLAGHGYRPVIAHVERYPCLMRHRHRLTRLKAAWPVLYQLNCETLLTPQSPRQRLRVQWMLRRQLIDIVATDAHNVTTRRPCMTQAYRLLCKCVPQTYADALLSHTPRRILRGW